MKKAILVAGFISVAAVAQAGVLGDIGRDVLRDTENKAVDHAVKKVVNPTGVQVLWKGTWYPASVLKTRETKKGTQSFIHYDGYSASWDEWVGPERIRN